MIAGFAALVALPSVLVTFGRIAGAAGRHLSTTGGEHMDASNTQVLPADLPRRVGPPAHGVRRVPGPALQGLLAVVIYLAIAAWYGFPLIRYLNVPVIGHLSPDPNFYLWCMRWFPYAVSHGLNPLYSNQIFAPGGISLAWTSPVPAVAIVMWPVTALFGPVVSYNLTALLLPPVTGWAAFVAARRLTRRFWASLLAGVVYGLCPYMAMEGARGELNLGAITLFPLMAYLVLLWRDGALRRTGFVTWMAVAMALQVYVFTEYFADMTVVLTAALVIGYAIAGRAEKRTVARLAGLIAIAYAGALVLASPYLIDALARYPRGFTRQQTVFSLQMVRLILPWSHRLVNLRPLMSYSKVLGAASIEDYVGIPLLVILLLLAVFAWPSKITRLLVLMFAIVIAIAAGPSLVVTDRPVLPLPWGWLWSLPVARSAVPLRFMVFGFLILAMAVALWLAAPTSSRLTQAARWGLVVLALATMWADVYPFVAAAVPPLEWRLPVGKIMRPAGTLPEFVTDGLYRRYVKPGEIVVVVSDRGNAGMLFQAYSGFYFRVAGGFVNISVSAEDPPAVTALMHPTPGAIRRFQDYVRHAGVGAVLVEQAWAEPWMSVLDRTGMHRTAAGGVIVYQPVTRAAPAASAGRPAPGFPRLP